MRRRRSVVVCLGVTALLAASAGCGSEEGSGDPEFAGVCVDKATGTRLDDAVCANDPLPDEAEFTAAPAVDPSAAAVATSGPGTPLPSGSPSASGGDLVTPPPAGATPTTSPVCVPTDAIAPTSGSTGTALPTSAAAVPCPPGQTATTPAPVSTTIVHSGSHGWYFIPFGMWSAPIGSRVTGGSYNPPTGTTFTQGGVSRSGGTVSKSTVSGGKVSTSRGGFGGSGSKAGS